MMCSVCGFSVDNDPNFCPHCGTKLKSDAPKQEAGKLYFHADGADAVERQPDFDNVTDENYDALKEFMYEIEVGVWVKNGEVEIQTINGHEVIRDDS